MATVRDVKFSRNGARWISVEGMLEGEAGVPKLIHDAVMARSNFEQTSEPIVL